MPAATYLEDLFNVQEHFEDAFAAYFDAHGFTTYRTGDTISRPDRLLIIQFMPGGATGLQASPDFTNLTHAEHCEFSGVLNIWLSNNREGPANSRLTTAKGADFDARRRMSRDIAVIRCLMLHNSVNNTTGSYSSQPLSLDFHTISYAIRFLGGQDTIADPERGIEGHEMQYEIKYRIKPDAWPTVE